MLIGLLGKKRVGKDTVADYLVEKYQFKKETLATPIKEVCKILFDFNDDQLYGDLKEEKDDYWNIEPRIIFQYLGTDIFRNDIKRILPDINNNFWVKTMEKRIGKHINNKNIVVSDLRFQNEVDMVHRLGGIVIKIDKDTSANDFQNHESETNIDTIQDYDILVNNNKKIIDLYEIIDNIVGPKI